MLCFANLTKADLSEAVLDEADLSGANMQGSNLRRVDLSLSILNRTNLSESDLRDADLHNVDLSSVDTKGATLQGVNLSGVDLRNFDFHGMNLVNAKLIGANLSAVDMSEANLSSADLSKADISRTNFSNSVLVRSDLSGTTLSQANLYQANFSGAVLIGVDLSDLDLSGVNLTGANLSEANLTRTQVLRTDFSHAIFTGARIEDWNINDRTLLDGAVCEYVYLGADRQARRPREGNFSPGEFSALFQQALDTVDLIFKDGIDWQSFFVSFQSLRQQYDSEDLSIQAIEKKKGGSFVVRIEVPNSDDKAAIERTIKAEYSHQLQLMEQKYAELSLLKDEQLRYARVSIENERREKATMIGVIKSMANSQNEPKYQFNNSKFGGGFSAEGGIQIGGTLNDLSQAQDLVQAASEIQALLTQLDTQELSDVDKQDEAAKVLAMKAKEDPTLMGKLVGWGKALSGDATKSATNEAAKVAGGEVTKVIITKALTILGLTLL